MSAFVDRLQAHLPGALGQPDLRVTDAARIPGGASRHTWIVTTAAPERRLIVRLDPEASLLESNRAVEYGCYRAMGEVDAVPVPAVVLDEDDETPLGRPFFVMEAVEGQSSGGALVMLPPEERASIARHQAEVLAAISTSDWEGLGLGSLLPPVEATTAWSTELDKWERVLDEHDLGPVPITRGAIRWLRRNPPPPPERVALVHGDYRSGNFLFAGGRVTAVLDWEMAHLGDPVEDLTWGFLQNWRYDTANLDLVGGLQAKADAVAAWEQASGLRADPHALRWWELLGHVKAIAIWITGGHQYATGATGDVLLALIPWLYGDKQEAWMLELLP